MESEADLFQAGDLHRELQEPADQRADGHAEQGPRTEGRIEHPGQGYPTENRPKVVETRGQRRHAEDVARVEHAHDQRRQGHHQNKREHDAGQLDREGRLVRVESRGEQRNQRRGENNPEQGHEGHEDEHHRRHLARQFPRGLVAFLHPELGKHRDKCHRQRPLGEEVAEQIRRTIRRDVGVHPPPRTEQRGKNQLARQPEHAAQHDGQRDDARRPCVQLFFTHAPPCVADP